MALPVLHDIGAVHMTKNNVIQDPGTGGTFVQNGMAYGTATVGAGTYKLPDGGLPQYVQASGAVTVTSYGGTTIVVLSSGQKALFEPLSSTTWCCTVLATGNVATTLTSSLGAVPIPLTSWRETGTDDTLAVVPGAGLGAGGVLGTDSTPALEYVNGDTDSSLRILWAASGAQPIVAQVMIPFDCDTTQPILFKVSGLMSGATNTPVLSLDTYYRDGGGSVSAKIEDNTSALSDAVETVTATIAASDFPAVSSGVPVFATIEVTPGSHTTDTLAIYGTYLQYTKKLLAS